MKIVIEVEPGLGANQIEALGKALYTMLGGENLSRFTVEISTDPPFDPRDGRTDLDYSRYALAARWGPSKLPDLMKLIDESKRLGFDRYPFGTLPGEKIDRDKGSEPDADRRQ